MRRWSTVGGALEMFSLPLPFHVLHKDVDIEAVFFFFFHNLQYKFSTSYTVCTVSHRIMCLFAFWRRVLTGSKCGASKELWLTIFLSSRISVSAFDRKNGLLERFVWIRTFTHRQWSFRQEAQLSLTDSSTLFCKVLGVLQDFLAENVDKNFTTHCNVAKVCHNPDRCRGCDGCRDLWGGIGEIEE